MSFDYPDKPKESETFLGLTAKEVFYGTFWLTDIALIALSVLVVVRLDHSGKFPGYMSGVWMLCMIASAGVAFRACRRAGFSREESRRETIERSAGAALAPLLGTAPVFDLGHTKKPRTRVDRDSISGYSSGSAWTRIEWKDVGSCSVMTRSDVFGNQNYCHILLSGHNRMMPLFQSQLSNADAAKLLPAIRFYLRGEEDVPQVLGGSS